jgi:hypothetical protein
MRWRYAVLVHEHGRDCDIELLRTNNPWPIAAGLKSKTLVVRRFGPRQRHAATTTNYTFVQVVDRRPPKRWGSG